jgi:hypothetical protein
VVKIDAMWIQLVVALGLRQVPPEIRNLLAAASFNRQAKAILRKEGEDHFVLRIDHSAI